MTILLFVVILVLLILVHEFGHFIAAKFFGVRVDEFGIGFPPKLFGKKFGETEYTINVFPVGGFVKIYGEDLETEKTSPDFKRSFVAQKKYKQAIILTAGIFGNVLFAWLLFWVGFSIGMPLAIDDTTGGTITDRKVLVLQTLPDSPAMRAGLLPNDQLIRIADASGKSAEGDADLMTSFIREHTDKEILITYRRGGEDKTATATPKTGVKSEDSTDGAIGIALGEAGTVSYPMHQAAVEAARFTVQMCYYVAVGIISLLVGLFTWSADLSTVSGPVGIAGLVGEASALGIGHLIAFTALISINLALVNLIPFPALDGGRLLFVGIEAITRRPMPARAAQIMNIVGFVLLILLMIIVTVGDIGRLL